LGFEEVGQMSTEAEAGFFGNAVRIGVDSAKKLLDLLRGLLIAVQDALMRLDVMLHLRLHLHSLRKDLPSF
jgi:hypothetical protein